MKQEPDLAAETILTANELKTQAEELESALHKYDLTEEESKEKVFFTHIIDVKGRAARFFIGLLVNRAGNIDQRGHGQVDQERLPKISLGLRAPWAQSASGHLYWCGFSHGQNRTRSNEYQTTTLLDYPQVSASPTLSPYFWQVREYFDVFWRRYKELGDWKKIIDKIERGERKIQVDFIALLELFIF